MSELEQNFDLPLEEVIGDRFGRYSKYIIQDRALPDVRDGLKPVQRRILYAMHVDGNTFEKNFRKAAKTVGTVIGNYHPHGDSSVYEAMVRLSQDWKMRHEIIEMHGNNGSVDGDPPAAMRYTEARLSSITRELMHNLDKNTVDFISNFDDTNSEPVVFPARFPNLLVNGSTGISAGYATDIPPHNLSEVIDAVIMKLDKPNVSVDELMTVIKGPDFPTGGIVQGTDGIKKAFETGKGRFIIRGRAEIEKMRGNREQIVITEIPFEVNKSAMVRKIDELNLDRKVEGITEVRDETDRTGMRVVVDLRKDADSRGILNYLYKNTDLQVTYHYNMVAIQDKTPKLLSLQAVLDAYIAHQKEVITRQTQFDLTKAKDRSHIVEGLIKAISVLDELIQTIRTSANKSDAKEKIMAQYKFSDLQAEAILSLQLYRLTNTDITSLTEEQAELTKEINALEDILSSEKVLLSKIKKELKTVKKEYNSPRRTEIVAEIEDIKIDIEVTVASEEVLVSMTKDGYIKRTSLRSYTASNGEGLPLKERDFLIQTFEMNTTDNILIFTNKGKFVSIPIHEIADVRWRDPGQHMSNITSFDNDEYIVEAIPVREFTEHQYLIFFTKHGMIKKSTLDLYDSPRYTRSMIALNLRKNDELINVNQSDGTNHIFMSSDSGNGLLVDEQEISPVGQRALGVIGMQLKDDEKMVSGSVFNQNLTKEVAIITQRGACKRMKLDLFEVSPRARRGLMMLRELKARPHLIKGAFIINPEDTLGFNTTRDVQKIFSPYEFPLSERISNGSFIIDADIDGEVNQTWKEASYSKPFPDKE